MNRRGFLVILLVGVGAAGLATIGINASGTIPRLHIHLGEERCRRCGMIISRINYAAAFYVEGELDWNKYDDIGCMIMDYHLASKDMVNAHAIKVFDFDTEEELDANSAYYILADVRKLRTPMGYNIIALKARTSAEENAKEHQSDVLTWDQALGIPKGGL